jgi:hypothetical protein
MSPNEAGIDAARLQTLWAEREIRNTLVRYSRGIDRCDEALIRSVYHDDSYDDHGDFKGSGPEFAAWDVPLLKQFEATMHDLGNVTLEVDGDSARAETYVVAYHVSRREETRHLITVGARYLDQFERRDDEWKIARRLVVIDWSKVERVDSSFPVEKYLQGARWPDDPSYEEL